MEPGLLNQVSLIEKSLFFGGKKHLPAKGTVSKESAPNLFTPKDTFSGLFHHNYTACSFFLTNMKKL
jgi:hypothetical protein